MNDPYKILNVDRSASDEEIKKAYRELARKYHPDNYVNNPLADLAQEKMKEINEAYDAVTRERGGGHASGGSRGSSGAGYGSGGAYGGTGVYARIRSLLAQNNLWQAEKELNAVSSRDAEWNFLMGSLLYKKGWLDEAMRHFDTACSMEPGNAEYAQARNMMHMGGAGSPYRGAPGGMPFAGTNACDCCSSLICADCCCECMGGDLIPCC